MVRVCAYCRVSTEKDDQINSLSNQIIFFQDYISKKDDWQLTEIYVDEGISGTSTKKRKSFNRMISDADNSKFDLILTKEISRFARNTLDSIYYTRYLKRKGIGVFFLNDNICTLDPDAELRLTIMSSIAQEESRKTSDRVKWGQKTRMEQGVVFGKSLVGFTVCDGNIEINEKEAPIIRKIFNDFVIGKKSCYSIAKELNESGVLSPKNWTSTSVLRILKNEKYCGDLVQAKSYTPDYLTHEKQENSKENYIIIKNHHKGIISHKTFNSAKEELFFRDKSFSGKHTFSALVECAECGSVLSARIKKGMITWKCLKCKQTDIKNDILNEVIRFLLKKYIDINSEIIRCLIKKVIISKEGKLKIKLIDNSEHNYIIVNTGKNYDNYKETIKYQRVHLDSNVGTEELAHLEMIGAIVYQLTRNLSMDEIKKSGFDTYFVDHTTGIYPTAASGYPYTAASMQVKGDLIADLHEDLGAEQKARVTYDNILRFCDDPDVKDPIKFLRQREVVHYQRFGEGLDLALQRLNSKNFYAINPSFDK